MLPTGSWYLPVGGVSVVGTTEDAATVAVASCLGEDMIVCDVSIDFAPGVTLMSVIIRLKLDSLVGVESGVVPV